jgi:hypothetical protein
MTSPIQKGEQKANRESLRLETTATRTKQKPAVISNRELEPVFYPFLCPPNAASPIQKGEQKANRESLRLEIDLTQTKQTTEAHSNRELEALFSRPRRGGSLFSDPPAFRPRFSGQVPSAKPQIRPPLRHENSNRESIRLEIVVTQTKQTTELHSNRELEGLFSIGSGLMIQPGEMLTTARSSSRQNAIPSPRKLLANSKNSKSLPPFLFRLKTTPVPCFVGVTYEF